MKNIDKSKLVLVHDADDRIVGQPLETKRSGITVTHGIDLKRTKLL